MYHPLHICALLYFTGLCKAFVKIEGQPPKLYDSTFDPVNHTADKVQHLIYCTVIVSEELQLLSPCWSSFVHHQWLQINPKQII